MRIRPFVIALVHPQQLRAQFRHFVLSDKAELVAENCGVLRSSLCRENPLREK